MNYDVLYLGGINMANKITQPIKDIEQIRKFKQEVNRGQNGFRNVLLVEIGLATALRISDLLKLRKNNIYDGFISIKTEKTDKPMRLELNPRVHKLVASYIELLNDDDLLFNFGYRQALKMLSAAAERADIKDFGTHTLRKTCAWQYYQHFGKDLRKTMVLLGHESPNDTIKYLNLDIDEVNKDLVTMDLN